MRRLVTALAVAGVVALLTASAAAAWLTAGPGIRHDPSPSWLTAPLPSPLLPALDPQAAPAPTAAGVTAAVGPLLRSPALGVASAVVTDVTSDRVLLDTADHQLVIPASTAKLVTAAAALTVLGPGHRLTTSVVAGPTPGSIVLVGGGDPTLAGPAAPPAAPGGLTPARLAELAAGVAHAGVSEVDEVVADASLYSGPVLGPGWLPSYVASGNVAPVTALMVDEGRVHPLAGIGVPRVSDPPAVAAGDLLALLPRYGVRVAPGARVAVGQAPVGARQLTSVQSPPLEDLVEAMLVNSDNDLAEALARQVAIGSRQPATFAGGATAIRTAVAALGVDPSGVALVDGSGLSRSDRLTPELLTGLLRLAAQPGHADLGALLSGLPVAGFSGTLADRYLSVPARAAAGQVRAKTGTLAGVSAVAGLVVDADGRLLAFDLTSDTVPLGSYRQAEAALDRVAATLAACGCR